MNPNIFTFLLVLSPLFALLSPRFLAFLPIIIAVLSYGAMYAYDSARLKKYIGSKYLIIVFIISALLFASSIWSFDSEYVLDKAFRVFVILFSGFLLWNASEFIYSGTRKIENFAKYYPLAVFLCCVAVFIEIISDFPLYKILHGLDYNSHINPSNMNRSVVALLILSVPAFFFCYFNKNIILAFALLLSLLFLFAVTQSQSAQMAFVIGCIIAIMPLANKWIRYLLAFSVVFLLVFAPWIAIWMFSNLPDITSNYGFFREGYAADRMEIWNFVSNYALNNPLYGYGLEATRLVEEFDTDKKYFAGVSVLHPHNFAIQIWMEYGALGVFIFSAIILYLFKEIGKLPNNINKIYMILFFVVLSISATGYGMWQSWWLGLVVISVAISKIAVSFAPNSKRS